MNEYILKHKVYLLLITGFIAFVLVSFFIDYEAGCIIFKNHFWLFFTEMILFLPFMFVLIGIADVWLPREKVEKHIGKSSGIKGIVLVIIMSMAQAGPLYGAFPVAYLLWKKGTGVRNIFIYLGAFCTIKIPMLAFETGFLGLKFSLLRTILSLPVIIIIAIIMEKYFEKRGFTMHQI